MTSPVQPILQLQDLNFAYPGEAALFVGLGLALPAGVSWLGGESGSGKSSLLRLLRGEQPLDGSLNLAGVRLADDPEAYRRQVFWHDPGDDSLDALRPAELAQRLQAGFPHWQGPAWDEHLDGFGLAPHAGKPLYALSTGTRRKVWLAAAFSARATLCLLDEPTAGLDRTSVEYLAHVLSDPLWKNTGRVVLVAAGMPLPGVSWAGTATLRT